jgi:hypothetical protein
MTSVQRIRPQSGTAWQGQHPAPERSDEAEHEPRRRRSTERAPAEPGTGQVVDREA